DGYKILYVFEVMLSTYTQEEESTPVKIKQVIMLLVHRLPLVLAILALLICFTCVKPAAATSPAFVRVIHASPDVGTADVFVDGAKLLSSFAFGAVTGYVPVPPGPHKVQIALVGKGIGGAAITQTLAVSPGYAYTVAAIGTQQSGLSLEVFVDSNLLSPGTGKFRGFQLSADGGAVSVVARGNMLLNGVGYQNASNYLSIAAGA